MKFLLLIHEQHTPVYDIETEEDVDCLNKRSSFDEIVQLPHNLRPASRSTQLKDAVQL